jgi:hypothetical protein
MNNGESVCSSASLTFFSPGETPFHIIDYLRQSPNVKENIPLEFPEFCFTRIHPRS